MLGFSGAICSLVERVYFMQFRVHREDIGIIQWVAVLSLRVERQCLYNGDDDSVRRKRRR